MSKRAKSSPGRHIPKPSEIGRETVHYTTRRSNRCRGSELRLMEIVVGTRPGVQLGGHGSRRDGVLVLPFGKGTSHGPGAGWLQATRPHGSSFHDRSVAALEKVSQSEAFANSVGYAHKDGVKSLLLTSRDGFGFRNRIVHAHPEQYHALGEQGFTPDDLFVHDVEPIPNARGFPATGFSQEIGKISLHDASRGFEIMLLVLSFLDEQFVAEFEFPWPCKNATSEEEYRRPRGIIESLALRHYPKIDPESFVPEIISKLHRAQPPVGGDGK